MEYFLGGDSAYETVGGLQNMSQGAVQARQEQQKPPVFRGKAVVMVIQGISLMDTFLMLYDEASNHYRVLHSCTSAGKEELEHTAAALNIWAAK